MIGGLRPYPETKPSGLPWLGDVPRHWEVMRTKYIFREADKRSTTGGEAHLSMSQRLGLVPAAQVERTLVSESYVGGKLVEENDLVLNRLKAHLGVFAHAKQSGLISPDYTVLRPAKGVNVRFFEYVLKSVACRAELRTRARGIVEGFWRLYTDDFYDIRLPVPPLDEQQLTVRFLDWHGAQTAKLVRAKKKLIALLNEQKQAVVRRAVTRGLDPSTKLKPSGVPWLGDVPEGWEVIPLKRVTTERCDGPFGSGLKSSHYTPRGIVVVRLQNIGTGSFKLTNRAFISEDHYKSLGDHSVRADDLLIASLGDDRHPCGRACVAPHDLGDAMVKADCFRFRLDRGRADPHFVAASLSATAKESSAILSAGATRQRVNLQSTAERALALPRVDQQARIVSYLAAKNEEFEPLLESAHREINLIQEFRSRLIADVVTGKVDVRALAASLPEITDLEIVDDLVEQDDFEEPIDDAENEEVAA
jgi:type I restriction enzyme S subunit